MAKYEKLVRDRIPELLDQKGVPYEKHIADDTEYKQELVKKLMEEAQEFSDDPSVEELADVLEVVKALERLPDYAQLEAARVKKRTERGGFEDRIVLTGEK